jgi:hypothetical protein
MSSKSCIILQSCKTNEYTFTRSVNSQDASEPFWTGLLNTVVQITEPANFPDMYYIVVEICYSNQAPNSECLDCKNSTVEADGVPLEYVIPTGLTECPTGDAYVLVNCLANPSVFTQGMTPEEIVQSPTTALVTSSDLSFYVGSVVNIEEFPGNCYTVYGPYGTQTGCPCPYYTVTKTHPDCECCLVPEPKPWIRSIQEPVKDHTIVTVSDCDIQINKKFAENYYKLFKGLNYGIENCCNGIDYDTLWMQKEMSDYSMMKNPDLC